MPRSRFARSLGPILLLLVGGAYALASWNWCGRWEAGPPTLVSFGMSKGPLRVGAARERLDPAFPIVVAGYNPPRPEAREADEGLEARALVLEAPPLKVGLVSLDLLLVSDALSADIRRRVEALGLSAVLVTATHTHSSMGAFDDRLVSQLAGTGRYREGAKKLAAAAAANALEAAAANIQPVTLTYGEGDAPALNRPRTGTKADPALQHFVFTGEAGPVAQLVVLAAHPTLVSRDTERLEPDYPGELDPEGGPVTVVLQGAVGNASARVPEGDGPAQARYAAAVEAALGELGAQEVPEPYLGFARVSTALPRPDATRIAPWFARAAGDNLLCSSASHHAEVYALRLGGEVLVTVPFEPSYAAGRAIREASGAGRVVGLANGYSGYLEPPEVVKEEGGESKRQYFSPKLLQTLTEAAKLAAKVVRPKEAEAVQAEGRDGGP